MPSRKRKRMSSSSSSGSARPFSRTLVIFTKRSQLHYKDILQGFFLSDFKQNTPDYERIKLKAGKRGALIFYVLFRTPQEAEVAANRLRALPFAPPFRCEHPPNGEDLDLHHSRKNYIYPIRNGPSNRVEMLCELSVPLDEWKLALYRCWEDHISTFEHDGILNKKKRVIVTFKNVQVASACVYMVHKYTTVTPSFLDTDSKSEKTYIQDASVRLFYTTNTTMLIDVFSKNGYIANQHDLGVVVTLQEPNHCEKFDAFCQAGGWTPVVSGFWPKNSSHEANDVKPELRHLALPSTSRFYAFCRTPTNILYIWNLPKNQSLIEIYAPFIPELIDLRTCGNDGERDSYAFITFKSIEVVNEILKRNDDNFLVEGKFIYLWYGQSMWPFSDEVVVKNEQ